MKHIKLFEDFNNESKKNKTVDKRIIDTTEEFKDFCNSYENEIRANVYGESDGWNQKMDAINKIIKKNKITISDKIWDSEEIYDIINNI